MDRQLVKQRRDLLIDTKKRFEIIERIALELYRTDKAELTSKQVLEVSRELLTPEQQEEMEGSLREIVTCSFLIRTGNEYRFSHQSFLEYLVACRLAKDIMDDKPENLRLKSLNRAILGFLIELEEGIVQRNSIMVGTGNTIVSFNQKRLESWFRTNPRDKWLGTNAVSLLVRLLSANQIRELPLAEADLAKADLREADLAEVNLKRAHLEGAHLEWAHLEGAHLEGAHLDLETAKLRKPKSKK